MVIEKHVSFICIYIYITIHVRVLPSGKRLHNYGKSPFLQGKSTMNGHFP